MGAFRHYTRPHRDPDEERLDAGTVIFPMQGRWSFASSAGSGEVDPGVVVVGTVSAVGDSLTWVALVWLALSRGSAAAVGTLVVVSMAPVVVGGFLMGALLDRFDRRRVLVVVNLVLGVAVGSIPLVHHLGGVHLWHAYVVAALYGLLKMANWAGVPSLVPSLVPQDDLNTANALESVSLASPMWPDRLSPGR